MSLLDFGGAAAYGTALQPMQMEQQGQQFGLEQGQRQAQVNALQGVDLNNPASIDAGITKLIHANSFDQANALMGLNATRTIYGSILPMVAQKLSGASPQQTSQPQTAQASPDANSPEFAQAHGDIMGQAQQAVQQLQQTPVADRPALAAQIKQKFVGMGVPEGAVDAELDDLSDAGLAKVSQHYQDHSQWMQGGGQTEPAPQSPTNYDWAMKAIQDPNLNNPFVQAALKRVGFDIEPYMARAQAVAQPFVNKAAELQYAPEIMTQTEAARHATGLAFAPAEIAMEAQKAGAVATAQEAAKAPYDFETVKGPNGQDVYVRKDFALGYAAAHGGVLGQSIAPAEQAFRTAQSGQAAEILKPDPQGLAQAKDTQANAERALSIIANMKFDPTTPFKVQAANALRAAGLGGDVDRYAADAAGYQAITTQALTSGAHNVFPARVTNTDLKLMHNVFPTLTTPNDQAAVAMGTQAAQAVRTQDWEDFKANYQGPHDSPDDIYKAWIKGPGGQSIFQSREWANIPIGGRPAFNPETDVKTIKGQKIGAWGIGTGHPVYFQVK